MPFLWSMHPLLALEPGARLVLGGVHRRGDHECDRVRPGFGRRDRRLAACGPAGTAARPTCRGSPGSKPGPHSRPTPGPHHSTGQPSRSSPTERDSPSTGIGRPHRSSACGSTPEAGRPVRAATRSRSSRPPRRTTISPVPWPQGARPGRGSTMTSRGGRRSASSAPTAGHDPTMTRGRSIPVRAWAAPVVIPTYPAIAGRPQPDVPREARLPGQQRTVYPNPFTDRVSDERVDRAVAGRPPRERVRPADDPARDRRPDPRRPGQDERLRLLLPPARHQAGARRAARSVDLRRRRVQLAAAPPAVHVHAGRLGDRGGGRRQPDRLAERARADGPHEGHGRRSGCVPARRSSRRGCGSPTGRRSSRRSCGGPTSGSASTTTTSRSSRPM